MKEITHILFGFCLILNYAAFLLAESPKAFAGMVFAGLFLIADILKTK